MSHGGCIYVAFKMDDAVVFDLRYILKKKKKKSSSAACLLVIFETEFLLHFLFKRVALMM